MLFVYVCFNDYVTAFVSPGYISSLNAGFDVVFLIFLSYFLTAEVAARSGGTWGIRVNGKSMRNRLEMTQEGTGFLDL